MPISYTVIMIDARTSNNKSMAILHRPTVTVEIEQFFKFNKEPKIFFESIMLSRIK